MSTEMLTALCTQEDVHKALLVQYLDKIFVQNYDYEFSVEQVLQMLEEYKLTPEKFYEFFYEYCRINDIEVLETEQKGNPNKKFKYNIPQASFSFFKAPIQNKIPSNVINLVDLYHTMSTHKEYKSNTEKLRKIVDKKEARIFKAKHFDYVTFSGIFSERSEKKLLQPSGLICLDFDHLSDLDDTIQKLRQDELTLLLFKSPSGDGCKWIVQIDLSKANHTIQFKALTRYVASTYALTVDESGKDICRACFIPFDENAYINPKILDE